MVSRSMAEPSDCLVKSLSLHSDFLAKQKMVAVHDSDSEEEPHTTVRKWSCIMCKRSPCKEYETCLRCEVVLNVPGGPDSPEYKEAARLGAFFHDRSKTFQVIAGMPPTIKGDLLQRFPQMMKMRQIQRLHVAKVQPGLTTDA